MTTPAPHRMVHVQSYTNGKAVITVTGKGGHLTFEVSIDDPTPTIALTNPAHGQYPVRAVVTLKANGQLQGFFVDGKNAETGKENLVWFPAKKKRAPKPARGKRAA